MKKTILVVLALILACGLLVSCADSTATDKEATPMKSSETEEKETQAVTTESMTEDIIDPYAETFDISWGPAGASGSYVIPDNIVEQMLEEKFNVNITVNQVQANNGDQVNLMLATGSIPDICFLYKSVQFMYDEGLIRSIPETMIREYAPNYAAFMDAHPKGWLLNRYPDGAGGYVEGEYGAFTGYNASLTGFHYMAMYRYDWMQNLGIEAKGKVTEIYPRIYFCADAFTIDEFTDIIKAFKDDDPDGNGQDDTLGLSGSPRLDYTLYGYAGAFGVKCIGDNKEFTENGAATPYYVSDAWENLLIYLSDMYNQGYVDPEWVTQDQNLYAEKFTTGKIGMMGFNRTTIETRFGHIPPHSALAYNEDAKILLTPSVIGENGEQYAPQYTTTQFAYTTYVGADVDDAKLGRILQIVDALSSDPEMFVLVNYGIAGETFDWEGEVLNSGVLLHTDLDTETKGEYAIEAYNTFFRAPEFTKFINFAPLQFIYDYANSEEGLSKTTLPDYYDDDSGQYKEKQKEWDDFYSAEMKIIRDEFYGDALLGADVAGEWDTYITDLKERADLDGLLDLLSKYDYLVDVYDLEGLVAE